MTAVAFPSNVLDFGNDYLTGLAADGNDLGMVCARAMTITGVQFRADANPGQTLTLTINKNGASVATLTVSTAGTQTPSGLPVSCAQGDRLIVALSGTANVTGISYTVAARAAAPIV